MSEKSRENSLRRRLSKMGFLLQKSRIRNINIDNFGEYMILDAYNGHVVAGERFNLNIDNVEQFVKE